MQKLDAKHEASWSEYWNRSSISMPHSRRTELFCIPHKHLLRLGSATQMGSGMSRVHVGYGANYMWKTANKYNESAHMPPAGLWKNHYTGNDYGWPAYTTDINTQAPYFAV